MKNIVDYLTKLHIQAPSALYEKKAQSQLNSLTKPQGALGQLECIAKQICALQHTIKPCVTPIFISVFAGEHGVAKQGVSAYPQSVTTQMVENFCGGGAAINVLAKKLNAEFEVAQLAGITQAKTHPKLIGNWICEQTGDASQTNAMNTQQLDQAFCAGIEAANRAKKKGAKTFIGGEMGIGNTTIASALCCLLTGHTPEQMTGHGTGIDEKILQKKIQIIKKIIKRHGGKSLIETLQGSGGFEILALTAAYIQAAHLNFLVLVDGFIASTAALIATKINPAVRPFLLFSHTSPETGFQLLSQYLQAKPLLDLAMRLGEGTGATLSMPIIQSAVDLFNQMASFEQAGVDEKT